LSDYHAIELESVIRLRCATATGHLRGLVRIDTTKIGGLSPMRDEGHDMVLCGRAVA